MKSYDFRTLPITSGVYQFTDEAGKILYIGKAKSLRNRVKSYFAKEVGRGPAIDLMIELAKEIKWIETESEIEAILLEADLINKLKPKYNVRLRDDKSFLVIKIVKPNYSSSDSEKFRIKVLGTTASNNNPNRFPCVELVRYKNIDFSDKSSWYFGPYPSGLLLKKSLYYLRKIFPFRDCSKVKYNTYRRKGRPCIYGDIRVCTGPCVNWVNEAEYKKNIDFLKDFLKGKKRSIIKKLNSQMQALSKEKRFEEAGLIRNKLNALEHLKDVAIGLRDDAFNGENILFPRIECFDISNISGLYAVGSMIVFKNGKPDTDEYRKFKIKFTNEPNDVLMLSEMLSRRFKNDWPLPNLVLIDGGENQLRVATEILKKFNLNIPAVSISKGKKRDKNEFHFSDEAIAKYVNKNISLQKILIQARDEAHRFAINYYRSLHKKGLFE
ncbi:MAG: GIY-YIG nuclease family protein [Patescibacteria group bacterium]|nr:GIY-YIG nuclease family protein [Patescibacteria group bacterium]